MTGRGIANLHAFPRSRSFVRGAVTINLRPGRLFSMIFTIAAAAPEIVRWDDMFDLYWGNDPHGGPINYRLNLWLSARKCNVHLGRIGLEISGGRGLGKQMGGYVMLDQKTCGRQVVAGGALPPVCGGRGDARQARWSRTAHNYFPETQRQFHRDYARAGRAE